MPRADSQKPAGALCLLPRYPASGHFRLATDSPTGTVRPSAAYPQAALTKNRPHASRCCRWPIRWSTRSSSDRPRLQPIRWC